MYIVTWMARALLGNGPVNIRDTRWLSMGSVPRPLLCNRSVNTFQQYRLLSAWSVQRLHNDSYKYNKFKEAQTRVEAGSNTSTVTLRLVGGD
jgi:hypothetical protein